MLIKHPPQGLFIEFYSLGQIIIVEVNLTEIGNHRGLDIVKSAFGSYIARPHQPRISLSRIHAPCHPDIAHIDIGYRATPLIGSIERLGISRRSHRIIGRSRIITLSLDAAPGLRHHIGQRPLLYTFEKSCIVDVAHRCGTGSRLQRRHDHHAPQEHEAHCPTLGSLRQGAGSPAAPRSRYPAYYSEHSQ